jgi:Arc/MetJ-type ribon-helix-helix transcriptional regulator
MGAKEVSVSLPEELVEAIQELAGSENVSTFVAKVLARDLERRRRLLRALDDLDEEFGPPSDQDRAWARKILRG